jgi:superfamily II RNA helicase
MVVICNTPYPEESSFQEHFDTFSFPLSDFQKYAIQSIVEGNHVLVTAHTGSGKTLPAEFAIRHFAQKGKKLIYTSPIKALSNQKFHDFTQKFPDISFGLFTGDIKTNPDADVLIMTTEILMNYLFTSLNKNTDDIAKQQTTLQFDIDVQNDLGCVVFDEVHYINDADRGQVWEKTILMLPTHVQMVMLSATIDNPAGFAKWCERGDESENRKQVYLASTNHRVVPLTHYAFLTSVESIFKHVKDKVTQKEIKDATNKLLLLQDANGQFSQPTYDKVNKIEKLYKINRQFIKRKHVLNQLSQYLRDNEMLPAIAFVFSRKQVETCADDITVPLLEFDSKVGYTVRRECEQIVRKLPNHQEYLDLPEYNHLVSLLEKGIGIHHSGMIPILREIVELMISKKYIKLLFATESFAIGLDCPIKTAIFTNVMKFDGHGERYLHAHEYTQMAGRAGRRGIDTLGYVVHCNNLFSLPSAYEYRQIMGGVPQKLVSKYHISYSLIFNLLKNGQKCNFHCFSEKSMVHKEIQQSVKSQYADIEAIQLKIDSVNTKTKTPIDMCNMYIEQEKLYKNGSNNVRKRADKEMKRLKSEYNNIDTDIMQIKRLNELNSECDRMKYDAEFTQQYILSQTAKVCKILIEDGFICCSNESMCFIYVPTNTYELTKIGQIASNIAEIHPLIITRLLEPWNYFENFTHKQIIGLFSCFADIKLPDDSRCNYPDSEDIFLNNRIKEVATMYSQYDGIEGEKDIRTGIDYNVLNYDLIDIAMKWCDCQNETDCRVFIENEVKQYSISIGDFTKAMLKIATITREWMTVFEQLGYVETLHKLSMIEPMILKYVMTSQSLYV